MASQGNAMKKKVLYLFLGILLVCVCFWLRYRVVNRQFYKFVRDIKLEFEYVESISVGDHGPYCWITVYVKEDSCDYEKLEPVFIKIMTGIVQKENFQYFSERHDKWAGGSPVFVNVVFRQEGINDEELCRYESQQDFEVWELESDRSVKFRVSDYLLLWWLKVNVFPVHLDDYLI